MFRDDRKPMPYELDEQAWWRKYHVVIQAVMAGSVLVLLLVVTLTLLPKQPSLPEPPKRVVLVVWVDAWRHDYMTLYGDMLPILSKLASTGVTATLAPVFPSVTATNSWTAVTGLLPEVHGILNDVMVNYEYQTNGTKMVSILNSWNFSKEDFSSDESWFRGEPIWTTLSKQGLKTACYGFKLCTASFVNEPPYYHSENTSARYSAHISTVLNWISSNSSISLLFVRMGGLEEISREFGPDPSRIVTEAIMIDSAIGALMSGISDLNMTQNVDLLVLSSHGVLSFSSDRLIFIDNLIDLSSVTIVTLSPVAMIVPIYQSKIPELAGNLSHPNLTVYMSSNIPSHYHINHSHLPPIIAIANPGYTITVRRGERDRGIWGYQSDTPDMRSFLLGYGPRFKKNTKIDLINMSDVYVIFCELFGVNCEATRSTFINSILV